MSVREDVAASLDIAATRFGECASAGNWPWAEKWLAAAILLATLEPSALERDG